MQERKTNYIDGGGQNITYIIVGIVAGILVYLLTKYKKYDRYTDKFDETYPDAKSNKKRTLDIMSLRFCYIKNVQTIQTNYFYLFIMKEKEAVKGAFEKKI